MLALAFLGWVLCVRKRSWKNGLGFILVLVGLGISITIKANVIVVLPAFLISGILLGMFSNIDRSEARRTLLVAVSVAGLFLALGLLIPVLGPFSRNSIAYYIELVNRYLENAGLHTIPAFLGPFISPAKNIFFFSPILFLLPWVVLKYWREYAYFILPTMFTVVFLALAQAMHLGDMWAGTLIWGLRFMLPSLPLLAVIIAPWILNLVTTTSLLTRIAGMSILFVSFLVQLAGAVVKWASPFLYWANQGLDPVAPNAVWDIKFQVIPIHLKGLSNPNLWDVAWIHTLAIDYRAQFIPLISLFLFLVGLSFALRNVSTTYSSIMVIFCLIMVFGALVAPIYPTLNIIKNDPRVCDNSNAPISVIEYARNQVKTGDLVLVDSYGSCLWYQMLNFWVESIPWYSLPYEFPGTTSIAMESGEASSLASLQLIEDLAPDHDRIFYLTSSDTHDYVLRREESWLKSHYELKEEIQFKDEEISRLLIYSISGSLN
jgi:hypothetical protein